MRRRISTVFALRLAALAALMVSCGKNPADSDIRKDLIPLTVGNYWAYQQLWYTGVGEEVTEGLTDSALFMIIADTLLSINGTEHRAAIESFTFPLDGIPADYRWLYWNGDDGTYLMGGISSNDTLIYKSMVYKYPISKGDSWQVHRPFYETYLQEFGIEDSLTTYTCVATDEKFETPIGTFTCYVYHHRVTIYEEPGEPIEDWDYYVYVAPGIGHVGTLIRSGIDGQLKWKIGLYDYQIN